VAGQAAVKLMVHCFAGTAGSLETGTDWKRPISWCSAKYMN
jgi:hypothetical protein